MPNKENKKTNQLGGNVKKDLLRLKQNVTECERTVKIENIFTKCSLRHMSTQYGGLEVLIE